MKRKLNIGFKNRVKKRKARVLNGRNLSF